MAGKPVARLGDPGSHGGKISTGSSPIFVNALPVALVGDTYSCPIHGSTRSRRVLHTFLDLVEMSRMLDL
ncbi:PAAR domain-containing protein [Pseudomonas sp. SJZ131]|uniref:PAAR domain-containing protein n=1 Tax=Pseudomonas sp. SJZ131 TaxID=2572895 RepID=UPI00119DED56